MTAEPQAQAPHVDDPWPEGYPGWRRVHLFASWIVVGVGAAHSIVTAFAYSRWSPSAAWFLGAGLGVILLGSLNLVHIGLRPCRLPTARFVRAANLAFALYGIAAMFAVPEPPAVVLVVGLGAQVLAGRVTIPGPS